MATWQGVQSVLLNAGTELGSNLKNIGSAQDLQALLTRALVDYPDPFVKVFAACLVVSIAVFVLGFATNNYSWVDKIWSIIPVYYAWVLATQVPSAAADIHPRLAIIAGLISVWGARLSYNFWRKGGYAYSGEDYRWPVLRAGMSPLTFQVFNLVFISFIQNVLLATILSPVYVAWTASYSSRGALLTPLNAIDALATVLAAGWLVMEAVADQQQWNFQTAKHARINAGKRLTGPYAKGFITSGLWKYSRHPNFFAEQAFWWSLCLFATAATGRWVGWWLGGAVALSALFQGSTDFTEKISASKYPHYKEYQSSTSRLMPWFPAASAAAPSTPRGRKSPARPARTPTQEAEPKPGTPRAEAAEAAAVPEPAPAARRGRAATSSRKTSTSAASKSRSRSRSASDAAPAAKKAAAPKAPARSRSKSTSRAASSSKTKATASTVEAKPVRRATRARKA